MSLRPVDSRSVARAIVAVALLCLSLAAFANAETPAATCPPTPSAQSATAPSSAQPVPEQVIACIGSLPIAASTVQHWSVVARKSEGGSSKHRLTGREVVSEVMGFLISSDWVLAEAHELGIVVSEAEVRHTFDRIRDQQFPRRKEFKAFLEESGETVADLVTRVRVNLLSQRIQKKVLAGHRSQRSRVQALERFTKEFKTRWTAQTYCEPAYAIADCGHVQAPL